MSLILYDLLDFIDYLVGVWRNAVLNDDILHFWVIHFNTTNAVWSKYEILYRVRP